MEIIKELKKFRGIERYTLQMMALLLSTLTKPQEQYDSGYRWRDRLGNLHKPSEMSDKHVFYTWLMIWNHSVPSRYTIWFSYKYVFMDFYSNEYMQQSFNILYCEMKKRSYGIATQRTIETIEKYIKICPDLETIKIK